MNAPKTKTLPTLSFDKRLAHLNDVKEELNLSLDGFEARFDRLAADANAFPQAALDAMLVLDELAARIKKAAEAAEAAAIKHYTDKGQFEHGKVAITFKDTPKTSIAWKDIAADLAKAKALAANGTFDIKAFEEDMKKKFGKKTSSTAVKLTVSA